MQFTIVKEKLEKFPQFIKAGNHHEYEGMYVMFEGSSL